MINFFTQKPPRRQHSLLARLIGGLILIGFATGNILLFLQSFGYSLGWSQLAFVIGSVLLLTALIWSIATLSTKVLVAKLDSRQLRVFQLIVFVVVLGISTLIVLQLT